MDKYVLALCDSEYNGFAELNVYNTIVDAYNEAWIACWDDIKKIKDYYREVNNSDAWIKRYPDGRIEGSFSYNNAESYFAIKEIEHDF